MIYKTHQLIKAVVSGANHGQLLKHLGEKAARQ